jgi:hypothetical protein
MLEKPFQIISQCRGRCIPPRRLTVDRRVDDRLQITRQMRYEAPQPLGLLAHHPAHRFVAIDPLESRSQAEQFVEGQPQGIDVRAGVAFALESFRCHVPECADDVARAGDVLGVVSLGQAEIGDPDVSLGI